MIGIGNDHAPTAASEGLALWGRARRLATLALVLGVALLAPAAARAGQLFQYTLNAGNLTGTLNGVAFTNARYTITAVADTANLTSGIWDLGITYYFIPATTVTITVEGMTPVNFTSLVYGPRSLDYSGLGFSGFSGIGFGDSGLTKFGFEVLIDVNTYNNLSSPASLSGVMGNPSNPTYSTTGGVLNITDSGTFPPGTFTITPFTPPVPEPATLMTAGLGGVLALMRARRRRVAPRA